MKRKREKQSGFTLVEMIATVALIGTLAIVTAPVISSAYEAMTTHVARSDLQEQANVAMAWMTREIRNADAIGTMTATDLEVSSDGGTTYNEYWLNGNNLERNTDSQNSTDDKVLASNLVTSTGLDFDYFQDADGSTDTVASIASEVKRIVITLNFSKNGQTLSVQSQVIPPNLQ